MQTHIPTKKLLKISLVLMALLLLGGLPAAAQKTSITMRGPAASLAFRPDGEQIAIGGFRKVVLRERATDRIVSELSGCGSTVTSLAYSADGSLLAAASGRPGTYGEIVLWDLKTHRLGARLVGPVDMVYGLAFRPGGKEIAGASYDRTVSIWQLPQGPMTGASIQPKLRLKDHIDAVYAVAYSPEGTRLASASGDRTVKVWDANTGKRLYTLSDSTAELYTVAFRPDGRQLAAGGVDKTLRVWNVGTGEGTLYKAAFAHDGAVLRIVYAHDGKSLLSTGEDNAVKQWNADSLEEEAVYPVQADWPQGLALSQDDHWIAIGCHNGAFHLYPTRGSGIGIRDSGFVFFSPSPPLPLSSSPRPPVSLSSLFPLPSSLRLVGLPQATMDAEVKRMPGNETFTGAQSIPVPAVVEGTLWNGKMDSTEAPNHYYRFRAIKGEKLVVDVLARRAGSPLDSFIAILDAQGKPVERAVIRAVSQSEVTLFDRDSVSTGIRLLPFPDLHLNDWVMVGREVLRVGALPKGPDDDTQFRSLNGQRIGYLGTTPEYHSIGTPVYKVEIHPAGTVFSRTGMPQRHLLYQNDDGGPLYGRDSYLEFTAPAAGDYIVRLTDSRGQQGEKYTYKLRVHPPRPDFKISINPQKPTLPQGGSTVVTVECERYEGFDAPIQVHLQDLPAGITATQSVIEAGETSTQLLLTAAPNTMLPAAPAPASFRVVASAAEFGSTGLMHTIDPDNVVRRISIGAASKLQATTDLSDVVLHPGGQTTVVATIVRSGGFAGRVPLDVRNLPFGVRVLDVGLNGVLITEQETARKFILYCEPWVQAQTRPIYVFANVENGVGTAAPPLLLKIE